VLPLHVETVTPLVPPGSMVFAFLLALQESFTAMPASRRLSDRVRLYPQLPSVLLHFEPDSNSPGCAVAAANKKNYGASRMKLAAPTTNVSKSGCNESDGSVNVVTIDHLL
jgi:hypothetical protein